MPKQKQPKLIQEPPKLSAKIRYEVPEGPHTHDPVSAIVELLGTGFGLQEQRPGDAVGALGAAMGMGLPLGKMKRGIPAFREKSGMALDVLEDMKNIRGENVLPVLDDFAGRMNNQSALSSSPLKDEWREGATAIWDDPVKYVGNLRAHDNKMALDNMAAGLGFTQSEPTEIDRLIQDLADFFAGPQFDPFGGPRRRFPLMGQEPKPGVQLKHKPPGDDDDPYDELLRRLRGK